MPPASAKLPPDPRPAGPIAPRRPDPSQSAMIGEMTPTLLSMADVREIMGYVSSGLHHTAAGPETQVANAAGVVLRHYATYMEDLGRVRTEQCAGWIGRQDVEAKRRAAAGSQAIFLSAIANLMRELGNLAEVRRRRHGERESPRRPAAMPAFDESAFKGQP